MCNHSYFNDLVVGPSDKAQPGMSPASQVSFPGFFSWNAAYSSQNEPPNIKKMGLSWII